MKPSFPGVTLFRDLPIGAAFTFATATKESAQINIKISARKYRNVIKHGQWTNYLIQSVKSTVNHLPEYE